MTSQNVSEKKLVPLLELINKHSSGLNKKYIQIPHIISTIERGLIPSMTEEQYFNHIEETIVGMASHHHDHLKLAARISIEQLQRNTPAKFTDSIELLRNHKCPNTGRPMNRLSDKFYQFVMSNADILNAAIVPERDYLYNYSGFKTLCKQSYLWSINNVIVETPQYALMRVACAIFAQSENLTIALKIYRLLSEHFYTQASPTLFNAGSPQQQMSSCFLLPISDDSIEGIYETLSKCAVISKHSGGIGFDVSNVRAANSIIRGTNGTSNGIIPMLRVFNESVRYVDQGGGKRKGAWAAYIQPWHADVEQFLELRLNTGVEAMRARDLFLGLWVPDLFMKRVEEDGYWTLMCPDECPGLVTSYGKEFEDLYTKYEAAGKGRKRIKAQDLFVKITDMQRYMSNPYFLYKDRCNERSNQKNSGVVRCANLCTEIVQVSSATEIAVCNLASISLKKFIEDGKFNFALLHEVVQTITMVLDTLIDVNYYTTKEARNSNLRHRPMGLGVQGLADAYFMLGLPYDSKEARILNVQIFETILHAAYTESCNLARQVGKPYDSYEGSPVSQGVLHPDVCPASGKYNPDFTSQMVLPLEEVKAGKGIAPLWNWDTLRLEIKKHGIRNSLLVAPMPTSSTSQILGNVESFEALTSNIYTRRTLSGEYTVVSEYLINDLISLDIWNDETRQRLIAANGSIQGISGIPDWIKLKHRTVYEIPQRNIVDMAADRMPFIDQNQSLNIHIKNPTSQQVSSMHFHAWKRGMKSSMYYLRRDASTDAIKFTIDSKYTRGVAPPRDFLGGSEGSNKDLEHINLGLDEPKQSTSGESCIIDKDGNKSCCGS